MPKKTVLQEDLEQICSNKAIPWEKLSGKTVLVTGATGLIGYCTVCTLLCYSQQTNTPVKVLALVRNLERAAAKFADQLAACPEKLAFLVGDVCDPISYDGPVDYITHRASQTASARFMAEPVETIRTSVDGTRNLLEFAREKQSSSFIYLSSMEVYGSPHDDAPIYEDSGTNVDTMRVRSCYPEAKRMSETLCACYCSEYGVPAKAVRLAQTFGAGIPATDVRVFAQFARSAINGENIVLLTDGSSRRSYLYTMDAVAAILTILLNGQNGEVYNAVNQATYCSVYEMAQMVAENFSDGIQVERRINAADAAKYPPTHHLNLQSDKLTALGWSAAYGLKQMYGRLIASMKESTKE